MRALRTGFIEIGTIGSIGRIGILGKGITNLLKFTKLLIIYHLNKRTNFSSEVPRFANKPKLHWKGVYSVYISFQGNELGGEDWCLSREINFLSEGVRFGLSQK